MKSSNLRFKVKFEEDGIVKICKVTELRFNKYGVSMIYYTDEGKKNAVSPIREDVVLLMYSSYSDKHSCLICDGDIIRKDGVGIVAVKFNTGDGFVVYDPECCEVCKNGDGAIESLEFFMVGAENKVEIIGNIYKNYNMILNLHWWKNM